MKLLILWMAVATLSISAVAAVEPVNLTCEYLTNPQGIDMSDPRFFWQVSSEQNGEKQTAYQLLVATSEKGLAENKGDAFDSGKVEGSDSIQMVYAGETLQSATDYFWKVRIWSKDGSPSEWSKPAKFATGLLKNSDWSNAQWIAWRDHAEWETVWWKRKEVELKCQEWYLPAYFGARMNMFERMYFHGENRYDPSPLIRKEVWVEKKVASAKAFISGLGYHELFINGKRVSDHVLDPGWTQYNQTVLYVAHDVTDYLKAGENAIGVMLGRGNYGSLAIDHWGFYKKGGYIGQPKLKCLVKIKYTDGSEKEVVSDLSWKVTGGPIQYDDPRMGEVYDATKEIPGWNTAGFNDAAWDNVNPAPSPDGDLKSQLCQPIRVVNVTKPKKVGPGGRGKFLVDTGTNMAGWIRVKVNAPKGTPITIYYGEESDPLEHGQPGGYQQMGYVAKGELGEVAECHFSYHGFRYAMIKGHENALTVDDIEVCQVNTDAPNAAAFETSDPMLNRLHTICRKSMESNLHSLPTDCPHREKNGWMGDATTGMEYGMANYDLAALMTKFVRDMLDTQDSQGRMSAITPCNTSARKQGRSPLWSSACVHVSWYMYNYYGDARIFEQNWDKLKLFTQGVWKHGGVKGKPGVIRDGYGDWCSPHKKSGVNEGGEVYSTMNFFLVLKRMAYMADILGKEDDAKAFNEQAEEVRAAIYTHCFDVKGIRFTGITPTDYRQGPNALALYYGIAKPEHCKPVLDDLLKNISKDRNMHVYGGIFTAQAAWELMPQTGNMQLAYDVLSTDTYPGYGFMLKDPETTSVWEHWTDGASHIHHFLGFIDNLLTRHIAGIRSDLAAPGYKNIIFEPKFIDDVDHAEYAYESIHGPVSIHWKKTAANQYTLDVTIPANCTGDVVLPAGLVKQIVIDDKERELKGYSANIFCASAVILDKKYVRLASGNHSVLVETGKGLN